MARQLVAKDVLLIGDSNVRRYLFRSGLHYAQSGEIGVARNQSEFNEALKLIQPDKYRIVVFAMLTNLVIDAGESGHDHSTRLSAIDEYLGGLLQTLR
jgi:hypothetical protein